MQVVDGAVSRIPHMPDEITRADALPLLKKICLADHVIIVVFISLVVQMTT